MEFNFNLKAHMDKFKTDNGFDYEKAQTSFQDQLNKFDAKNKPDMEELKSQVKDEAVSDFIKAQKIEGVENVEQFKAHSKRLGSNATELTEQNATLTRELDDLKTKLEEMTSTNGDLTKQITGFQRKETLTEKGFNKKYSKAVILEAESRMTDDVDFESALDLVKKDFPEWGNQKNKGFTTPQNQFDDNTEEEFMRKLAGL